MRVQTLKVNDKYVHIDVSLDEKHLNRIKVYRHAKKMGWL